MAKPCLGLVVAVDTSVERRRVGSFTLTGEKVRVGSIYEVDLEGMRLSAVIINIRVRSHEKTSLSSRLFKTSGITRRRSYPSHATAVTW